MECDDEAKSKLMAEEREDRIMLRGNDDDPQIFRLIQEFIRAIAHETPSEKIQREVTVISKIHQ